MKITTAWKTYRTTGYTTQVGDDPRATGGVHLIQIRKTGGKYYRRIVESNGRFQSATKAVPALPEEIEAAEAAE